MTKKNIKAKSKRMCPLSGMECKNNCMWYHNNVCEITNIKVALVDICNGINTIIDCRLQ